jgi:hypothetical protein
MELERAHLLRLPRELRDQIYGYLYHDVTFEWKWKVTKRGRALFDVTIRDAPRLSVILVCSRLHEEILQSAATTPMMIRWDGVLHKSTASYSSRINEKDRVRLENAFNYARNIVVLTSKPKWSIMSKFCNLIRDKAPRMASMVIGEASQVADASSPRQDPRNLHAQLANTLAMSRQNRKYPAPIPDRFGDFRLVQLGRSLQVETIFLWLPEDHLYFEVSSIRHSIERFEVYTYSKEGQPARYMCLKDLERCWPIFKFPSEHFEELSPRDKKTVSEFSERTWDQWRDDEVLALEHVVHVDGDKEIRADEGFARWFD